MKTLQAVWGWYVDIREIFYISSQTVTTTGATILSIPGTGHFHGKSISQIRQTIAASRLELEEVVIVALWSQFEAAIKDHVEKYRNIIIHDELDAFKHEIIDFRLDLKRSGFWKLESILDVYKSFMPTNTVGSLIEIYKYRNWIAHGKVFARPKIWAPDDTFKLLDTFLNDVYSIYP